MEGKSQQTEKAKASVSQTFTTRGTLTAILGLNVFCIDRKI
jgi:hypothetical protein